MRKPRLPKTKVCTKCGVEKLLGEYAIDARRKDGRQGRCRACSRAAWALRPAEERVRRNARARAAYAADPEKYRARDAKRRQDPVFRRHKAEQRAVWYANNRAYACQRQRVYILLNPKV